VLEQQLLAVDNTQAVDIQLVVERPEDIQQAEVPVQRQAEELQPDLQQH
jgi:hypothetical protein